jgi:flagellar motor switch protein FliM
MSADNTSAQPDPPSNSQAAEPLETASTPAPLATYTVYKTGGKHHTDKVSAYDFEAPSLLNDQESEFLKNLSQKWAHHIEGKLSMLLKVPFEITPEPVKVIEYGPLIRSLPTPTYLRIFGLQEPAGTGLLQIPSTLCGAWIARLLGGKCTLETEPRYLSEIETHLMEEIVKFTLDGWMRPWDAFAHLTYRLMGQESSGRFLHIAMPQTPMLSLSLAFQLEPNGPAPSLQVALPLSTLRPLLKTMCNQTAHAMRTDHKDLKWQKPYESITIPVYATWETEPMTLRDLLALRVGDTLLMPQDVVKQTYLKLDNAFEFIGEIGLEKDKMAFRIARHLKAPLNTPPCSTKNQT